MNWTNITIELVKALPAPLAALGALWWFSDPIKEVLEAIAFFIKNRRFTTKLPGLSVEVGEPLGDELRKLERVVEAAPEPPAASSKVLDTVEARRFVLRDETGMARVVIGFLERGRVKDAAITIFGPNGEVRITLIATNDEQAAVLVRSTEQRAINLIASSDLGPYLWVNDPTVNGAASLGAKRLWLAEGRVHLGETGDGNPNIVLTDKSGGHTFVAP